MKQWSFKYENLRQLEAFASDNRLDERATLLIQITSGILDIPRLRTIHEELRRVFPAALITGMGSALQMDGGEFFEDETVLTFTRFDKSRISEWSLSFDRTEGFEPERLADILASQVEEDTKGILLYTNTVTSDIEGLIIACQKRIEIPIFGGLATSFDPDNPSPYVVSTGKIYDEDAIVAIFMSGKDLLLRPDCLQAWESIGKEFTVTRAEGRKLCEVDGQSIMDVYSKYFGPLTKERLLYLSLAHPFLRHSKEFGEVSRVLLEYDGTCGVYTGAFKEGEKVQIGFGNYKSMIDCTKTNPEIFAQTPTEVFWGFVCISYTRGYADLLKKSMEPYLRNLPSIFFVVTFGEFGYVDGRNSFLNNTIVRIHLSEDPEARFVVDPIDVKLDEKDRLLETLSTLVTSSSREIIELNRYLEEEVRKRTKELADLNASLAKRIEQEVRKNREKDKMLYHQSKLAAMGEMISNIAHQWRQPLNIIALVMQDLAIKSKMGLLSPEMILLAEKKINETLKYLSDTIDDFRSFAAMGEEPAKPGRFEVGRAVRDAMRLVSVVLEDVDIRLQLDLPERECAVTGRANDFKQVLLNLVYNAIDVLKDKAVENPTIRIGIRCDKEVIVYVQDNGGGIEEGLIDKIFEPYFTTKYQARGTGLGLYMSKMIVEKRLGGEIVARNRLDGACFEIKLPLAAY